MTPQLGCSSSPSPQFRAARGSKQGMWTMPPSASPDDAWFTENSLPGDCVFIAVHSDEFGLGFQRDKEFFFFKQTVRLPACLTLGGQWGPGQLSVSWTDLWPWGESSLGFCLIWQASWLSMTHTQGLTWLCVCVCVCVCARESSDLGPGDTGRGLPS